MDEGDQADFSEYQKRYNDLNKLITTFKWRKAETSIREEAISAARYKFTQIQEKIDELKKKKPHITDE